MLAFLYLALASFLGDRINRHFYRFISIPHRIATSFLTGLLLATVITYLGSLLFARFSQPLIMGNVLFLAAFALVVYRVPAFPRGKYLNTVSERPARSERWDWICFGAFLVFACWLMFATLSFREGKFLIGFKGWTDFGANISLLQSFVLGHNFPTTHPFYPGEPIRYHFLFWFQTANLSFLGLNPVWSINLLSIFSLLALLILIITFAELLFRSRVVGRLAALLFLFSSSLYYLPFLQSQESWRGAVSAILNRTEFLPSGYPWRGENWGVLTISVLGNQRHLISGIAILFVVMNFLVDRYRAKLQEAPGIVSAKDSVEPATTIGSETAAVVAAAVAAPAADNDAAKGSNEATGGSASREIAATGTGSVTEAGVMSNEGATAVEVATGAPTTEESTTDGNRTSASDEAPDGKGAVDEGTTNKQPRAEIDRPLLYASVFSGVLIGLLPFWNSPVFVASLAVLGCLFLLFPHRVYLGSLLATVLVLGIPQVLMLRLRTLDQPLIHWGYTMDNPSVFQVVKYLGWSFGFKWLLILVALLFLSNAHRKLFLAASSLIAVVFLFQLSVDNFNNHKLLNVWAIFASVYAAFGLWRMAKTGLIGVALASILAVAMVFGGMVDLFPIHNDPMLTVPHSNDRLTTWLLENTKPADVFLSQTLLTHPILFTGRKIFLGNTLFAWTAGYRVGEREAIYRRMFAERDPNTLIRLLNENNIAYVAIDAGVRSNKAIKGLNEAVYQQNFEKVFDDTDRQYDFVTIYKVPPAQAGPMR